MECLLYAIWTLIVISGLATGALLVLLLTAPRHTIPLALLLTLASLSLGIWTVALVGVYYGRLDIVVASSLIAVFSSLLGYSLAAAGLPVVTATRPVVDLRIPEDDAQCPPAVILSACIEPAKYSPRAVTSSLKEFEETGVPLPSVWARPMLYAAERSRYQAAGGQSPGRKAAVSLAEQLADRLADESVGEIRISWCRLSPRVDEVVASLAKSGVTRMVLADLAATVSPMIEDSMRDLDAMNLHRFGILVRRTDSLWRSGAIADMIADRVLRTVRDDVGSAGVALVGSGQPAVWSRAHPSSEEQVTFFQQRLRMELVSRGFDESRIRLAWLQWSEPDVIETVRHLAALGAKKIVVVPTTMPVESLSTRVDLRHAVILARVPDDVDVTILEAWGDDPIVVEALAQSIKETIATF